MTLAERHSAEDLRITELLPQETLIFVLWRLPKTFDLAVAPSSTSSPPGVIYPGDDQVKQMFGRPLHLHRAPPLLPSPRQSRLFLHLTPPPSRRQTKAPLAYSWRCHMTNGGESRSGSRSPALYRCSSHIHHPFTRNYFLNPSVAPSFSESSRALRLSRPPRLLRPSAHSLHLV